MGHTVLQHNLELTHAQFKYGEEEVSILWQCNKLGDEVLSFLRTEYAHQCNKCAQEVRVFFEQIAHEQLRSLRNMYKG